MFLKVLQETHVLESVFIQVKAGNFIKKKLKTQVFFCETCKIF